MLERSQDSLEHVQTGRGRFELEPTTPAGHRFLKLAIEHSQLALQHAAEHDRAGTFPSEVFDAMKASGFLAATVPESHGGLGVDSIHDLAAGLCALGRADGSTSIAANMHLVFGIMLGWLRRHPPADPPFGFEAALEHMGGGCIVMGNVTETGTDIAHPLTRATPTEGGWRLSGHKTFGTLAPVADWFVVSCQALRPDGTRAGAYALVPRGSPGQEILDNWDSLGMRASGSQDITYSECFVPNRRLFGLSRDWGAEDAHSRILGILGNIGLLGTFLGIAEAARDHAVDRLGSERDGRRVAGDAAVRRLVAEMDVSLGSMRATVERATKLVDRATRPPAAKGPSEELSLELSAQFQSAKLFVNAEAIAIVDRAMTAIGGGSYMARHPLARLYRDVRAGPFMQPYSPKEAYEHIARPAIGPQADER